MKQKVLMIGLRSDSVDYNKWPQLSAEKLEAAFEQILTELANEGYNAVWCLTDQGETANNQVKEALVREDPDIVLIGAGVRTDPDLLLMFEQILNTIIKYSPSSKIAFNRLPYDSVEAVNRMANN